MKAVLFNKMGEKFYKLNNLSAKRFSLLTRKELYSIAKEVKCYDISEFAHYFSSYSNMKTKDLAQRAYIWAKETL